MTISEDLSLHINAGTTPYDLDNVTTRLGKITDAAKDLFVWTLRDYYNIQTTDRISIVPTIQKFSTNTPGSNADFDPLETVVRIIRQYPDIVEKLPYIGISVSSYKNDKLGLSSKFIGSVMPRPRLIAGINGSPPNPIVSPGDSPDVWPDSDQPTIPSNWPIDNTAIYSITDDDWLELTTIFDGVEYISRFLFGPNLLGSSPQTPRTMADIINLQALYVHADVVYIDGVPTLIIEPGGPCGNGTNISIQRTDASSNCDLNFQFIHDKLYAPSNDFPAANRYISSCQLTMTLLVGAESENIRSELTDTLLEYFTLILDDKQFTLFGRSFFGNIQNEYYLASILDSQITFSGEQEVARPDDPRRKVYLNRINIPIKFMQYIDRSTALGSTVKQNDNLPDRN
jgi:hypothetical protein